jgi:hypothetical protein
MVLKIPFYTDTIILSEAARRTYTFDNRGKRWTHRFDEIAHRRGQEEVVEKGRSPRPTQHSELHTLIMTSKISRRIAKLCSSERCIDSSNWITQTCTNLFRIIFEDGST